MDIHFCFPISADVSLCGELTEDEPIIMNIFKVTCPRCRELINEISRQVAFDSSLPKMEPVSSKD